MSILCRRVTYEKRQYVCIYPDTAGTRYDVVVSSIPLRTTVADRLVYCCSNKKRPNDARTTPGQQCYTSSTVRYRPYGSIRRQCTLRRSRNRLRTNHTYIYCTKLLLDRHDENVVGNWEHYPSTPSISVLDLQLGFLAAVPRIHISQAFLQ